MSSDLPSLSRSAVRNWTEQRFFDRGENYVREGRIRRPRREERTLKAECQGSQPNPYHVEAQLDEAGIAWAECSCPMGSGGYCKHVVALLLTWVQSPDEFDSMDSLDAALQGQSKSTLVQLILKMVDRHPDLERLVRLSTTNQDAPLDAEQLRSQIQSAFESVSYGYDYDPYAATHEITDDLEPFFTMAEDYGNNDRIGDAATVYRLLLEETQDYYSDFHDEDGELASLVSECSRRLGALLSDAEDGPLRETMLRTLFDTYTWDLDLGGYGIGDWASEAILENATPQERERVAGWVQEKIPSPPSSDSDRPSDRRVFVMSGSDSSWSTNWKREALGGFLLDLQKDSLDDDTYLRICRQTGRITDLVDRLLELDRLDDALDVTREASDYEVYQCTSIFTEHEAGAALHDLVLDRLNDSTDQRLVAWLRDYAKANDDLGRALDLSKRLFWARPSPERFRQIKSIAEEMDRWATVQSDLYEQLRENREYALLTRLHLAEGDVEAALETVPKAEQSFSWSYDRSSLPIEVAEAAEKEYPEEAIRLYTDRGRSLIDERGRDNYRQAAELYKRAKPLFDDPEKWTHLIESLYEEDLHRLPAAQDEFEKADLL